MIHNIYFMQYNKNQEEKDGEYWLYTELSNEEIHKSGLYEPNICKTILQIQNPILKEKMKEKLNSYIKEYGIVNTSFESCIASRLYSDEEIISIIQNDNFLNNLNNLEDNNIQTIISSITTYINICNMVKDEEFINQEINKIINIVKDKKDKDKIIITTLTFLEKINKKDLHNNIVNEYKEIIPDVYNKYLIINSNSNYLYNKSLEYNQNELKIGIDPNIKIGVEIETNNDNKLIIDFYNQNKFKGLYRSDDDATVPNGIEVTSKPFNDTIDYISKLNTIVNAIIKIFPKGEILLSEKISKNKKIDKEKETKEEKEKKIVGIYGREYLRLENKYQLIKDPVYKESLIIQLNKLQKEYEQLYEENNILR